MELARYDWSRTNTRQSDVDKSILPAFWLALVISTNQNRGMNTTAQKLSVDWLTSYLFQYFDEQEGQARGNKITLVKNNQ